MSMKFDMTRPLMGVNGRQLEIESRNIDGKKELKKADLRTVCIFALLEVNELDESRLGSDGNPAAKIISGEEKFKKFLVAEKIQKDDIVELEDEERALIRRLIGVGFNAEAVGVVWKMLDDPISSTEEESETSD